MNYKLYLGYTFPGNECHFIKHVEGKDSNDNRKKCLIERESEQWHEYKKVEDVESYTMIAVDNIYDAERKYFYTSYNGHISANYQKKNAEYTQTMSYEEYENLLTTCCSVTHKRINSCFYRTIDFNAYEILSMVCAISYENFTFADTGISTYIKGIEFNNFPVKLKKYFLDEMENELVIPRYSKALGFKKVLVNLLNTYLQHLTIDKSNIERLFFSDLKDICIKWLDAYQKKQLFYVKTTDFTNFYEERRMFEKYSEYYSKNETDGLYFEISQFLSSVGSYRLKNSIIYNLLKIDEIEYEIDGLR